MLDFDTNCNGSQQSLDNRANGPRVILKARLRKTSRQALGTGKEQTTRNIEHWEIGSIRLHDLLLSTSNPRLPVRE